jgi:sterol-4alpha-carboxylate 3-dehydrogenase (decarboxylating)
MSPAYESQQLGPSLVIGGSGFTGSHVVEQLLNEKGAGSITAASRNPRNDNCFDGVSYLSLDVCDAAAVTKLISEVRPEVIFHVAAPRAIDGANNPAVFHEAIIDGTRHVLDAAKASPTVKALVYTSTCAVHEGYEHFDLKEDAPMWNENSKTFPYYRAKALADQMVLAGNRRGNSAGQVSYEGILLTTSLRLPMCYGERDIQGIPGQLEALQKGQTKTQLGDGKNHVEPLYAPVCADAHILAAKASPLRGVRPLQRTSALTGKASSSLTAARSPSGTSRGGCGDKLETRQIPRM